MAGIIASKLIRSDDEVAYGDSGFVGIQKRPEIKEKEHFASIDYRTITAIWNVSPSINSDSICIIGVSNILLPPILNHILSTLAKLHLVSSSYSVPDLLYPN